MYARQASGISLDGNAGAWWSQAQGRYERGTPAVGAVLVFKPSGHMPVGHVAVVSQVVKPREILVDQANWVRGRVVKGMSVIDASANNDWTVVKVVELHSGTHGRPNQTYGFVYPRKPRPFARDTLLAGESEDKPSAKLPVQLAVARADDGLAELAKPPGAKAPAAKPDENATRKDHQKPQRSAAVRVPGPGVEVAKPSAAKPSAAKPSEDRPKAQRNAPVRAPGPPVGVAMLSAAQPPEDHPKAQRAAAVRVLGPREAAAKLSVAKPPEDHPKAQHAAAVRVREAAAKLSITKLPEDHPKAQRGAARSGAERAGGRK